MDNNCSYATYRRQSLADGGHRLKLNRQGITFTADNNMVAPYSPVLCFSYNYHINVEKCASILSVKYVSKYTTQGPDRLMVRSELQGDTSNRNKISNFKDMHCVGSCEAAYKLFQFPIATQFPSVKQLHFHLEDGQTFVFEEGNAEDDLAQSRGTEQTAFFDLNAWLKEQSILVDQIPMYVQVPEHFKLLDITKIQGKDLSVKMMN